MRFILVALMFVSINGFGQCKTYIIGVKGDTLNCVDLKGQKQGRWVVAVAGLRGEPGYEEEGVYLNDRKEGVWRKYSSVGDLLAMENYRWGSKHLQNFYFNNMGNLMREENWKAINPENPYDTIPIYDIDDPQKITRFEVIKLEGQTLKHGTWKIYDPYTGRIERTEKWWLDKPANSEGTGFDDLAPIDMTQGARSDTASKKIVSKPKEILDYEKKNSGKKKIKVRDGRTGGY